ncbi:hypothetical protein, partial [Streptomyces griseofuscus]
TAKLFGGARIDTTRLFGAAAFDTAKLFGGARIDTAKLLGATAGIRALGAAHRSVKESNPQ